MLKGYFGPRSTTLRLPAPQQFEPPVGPRVRNGVRCRVPQQLRGGTMKIEIPDADVREPLQQTIEVSAAAKDQDDVMARLHDRFGVGDR